MIAVVQFEDIKYVFNSVIDAFFVLMRMFFALDIKYPPMTQHCWILIQKLIFRFNCTTDDRSLSMPALDLIDKLR